MNKEKFQIPMPDERTIQTQIEQIVAAGVTQKESFIAYLTSMVRQIGFRHLFADRLGLVYIFLIALIVNSFMFFLAEPKKLAIQDLYGLIFLLSPLLFLMFSLFTYVHKMNNETLEVEMSCKYNVYQIIAFKMLAFSAVSIVANTISIAFLVTVYDDIHFLRAFMISITGLFVFSILFLYGMMKRRSTIAVATVVIIWTGGNVFFRFMNDALYTNLLVTMPLFVYGVVFIGSLYCYVRYLKRLIRFTQMKGAF
ncbi:hypothetical protein MHZ95_04075 [Sporosarcina sp. ACRSM]|uniref:hypothetical protein n=1 Tax=Sporosarcina sp. ACRSM TaxID=2918216 RepID=UPI001EF65CDE|nr:hypothetical protein [Sporosarcina sp. ACRSM]MCG7334458.1 hypothetical protein [Sporosarcina sp. ACRSM]